MHRQIDQDVNLILADNLGNVIVEKSFDVPRNVGMGLQSLGHCVGVTDIRIAEDFKLLMIVL